MGLYGSLWDLSGALLCLYGSLWIPMCLPQRSSAPSLPAPFLRPHSASANGASGERGGEGGASRAGLGEVDVASFA